MQQQAAQAYQQTAKQAAAPRDLEAQLLSKAAAKFIHVQENWDNEKQNLHAALTYNQRLWAVFLNSISREDSPLPKNLRENIANLGIFIFKQTLEIISNPSAEKLNILININREIAAGLRSRVS